MPSFRKSDFVGPPYPAPKSVLKAQSSMFPGEDEGAGLVTLSHDGTEGEEETGAFPSSGVLDEDG